MSRVCQLSGKGPSTGNNRSHSNRATKRRYLPNLVKKKVMNPITGRMERVKVATSTLRTLSKNPRKFFATV